VVQPRRNSDRFFLAKTLEQIMRGTSTPASPWIATAAMELNMERDRAYRFQHLRPNS
jgi:hypothetical protein